MRGSIAFQGCMSRKSGRAPCPRGVSMTGKKTLPTRRNTRLRLASLLGIAALAFGFAAGQTYGEAPSLAERVASGDLPPVEERLPVNPLVIEVVDEIGTYGGTMRRAFTGPGDHNSYTRMAYDSLVRYSSDGSEIVPHLVESWEASDDFHSWTLHLREGARWSD